MANYKKMKAANNNFATDKDREKLESDLTAIGIFGLEDPLRDDIETSIKKVKAAGLKVIMCTGDNLDTAKAISKQAGILDEEEAKDLSVIERKNFD